jgi:predicted lipid-binding transport protein (Tim44 family)
LFNNGFPGGIVTKVLIGLLCLILIAATIPVAVIMFDAPTPPPVMATMAAAPAQPRSSIPSPRQFQARDGATFHRPEAIRIIVPAIAGQR